MSLFDPLASAWCQRTRAWPALRGAGQALAWTAFFLAAILGIWSLETSLSPLPQLVLWGGLVLALVLALRRAITWFFGPVFFYDLVRSTRHGRHIGLRSLYVLLLLGMLSVLYAGRFWEGDLFQDLFRNRSLPTEEVPRFAEAFFVSFLQIQFIVILILTPIYASTSIAEEKQRRTLDFLLATDLSSREIVFGILAARLANLALLIVAGLPVLCLLQFLGGIDPNLVLAGFAATAVTIFSLGSLSILASVKYSRPLDAIFATYFWVAVYLVAGWCIPGVNLGHPGVGYYTLGRAWNTNVSHESILGQVVIAYLLFHLLGGCLLCSRAVWGLRTRALKPGLPPPQIVPPRPFSLPADDTPGLWPEVPRPEIGANPLLWKELHVDNAIRFDRFYPIFAAMVYCAAASVGMLALYVWILTLLLALANGQLGPMMNFWARLAGLPVALVMLLRVAFYASRSISRERERHTLDSLLTLPADRREILQAKCLGSILGLRRAWWVLGIVWALAVLSMGLNVLALPLVAVAFVVEAWFVANLGLWFSTVSRSATQATLKTMVVLLVLSIGPLLLAGFSNHGEQSGFLCFLLYGLSPPMPLLVLSFGYDDVLRPGGLASSANINAALGGLLCYAAAARILWHRTCARFHD